ncbi:MAG: pilus assembly FimT family protein [Phycisphaerales bacterium]
MNRRAFTLWELLVALSLLLLIGAVVVPVGHTWFRSAQFEEARMQLESALASARSEAQRDSCPVRIEVRSGTDGICHVVKISLQSTEGPRAAGSLPFPVSTQTSPDVAMAAEADDARTETVATLPRSVVVSASSDVPSAGAESEGETGTVEQVSSGMTSPEGAAAPFALATFMPDGEAVSCSAFLLTSSQGRAVRITIDGWTGRVRVESVDPAARTDRPPRAP